MMFNEYVELASRTNKERELNLNNEQSQVLHSLLGLSTELEELRGALDLLDMPNIIEEIGDMLWYVHILYDVYGFSYPEPSHPEVKLSSVLSVSHCVTSLSEFIADMMDLYKRHIFYNQELDVDELENMVDAVVYYLEILSYRSAGSMSEVMEKNIEKLAARYPEGFSDYHAVNRDLNKEREILEK